MPRGAGVPVVAVGVPVLDGTLDTVVLLSVRVRERGHGDPPVERGSFRMPEARTGDTVHDREVPE